MKVFAPNRPVFPSLADFGIQIPLLPSRPQMIWQALKADAASLGLALESWALCWEPQALLEAADLCRVHAESYVKELLSTRPDRCLLDTYELVDAQGQHHRYDPKLAKLPWSDLVHHILVEASGTLAACRAALAHDAVYYLGGGMHHAIPSGGRGFCLVHDIAIAIRALQAQGAIRTAWVIDVDAHKGDGTAAIFFRDPSVSTLSIHMATGWPLDEEPWDAEHRLKPQFLASTIDLGIPTKGEEKYLEALQSGLQLLPLLSSEQKPDLAIVVDGSDVHRHDELPSANLLELDDQQCLERDAMVYDFLQSRGIPQVWLLAGGYGPEAWKVHHRFLHPFLQIIAAQT